MRFCSYSFDISFLFRLETAETGMIAVRFLPFLILISLQWTVKHLELTLAFPLEWGNNAAWEPHWGHICMLMLHLLVSMRIRKSAIQPFSQTTITAAADVVTRSLALIGYRSVQLRREASLCVRWPLITPFGKNRNVT